MWVRALWGLLGGRDGRVVIRVEGCGRWWSMVIQQGQLGKLAADFEGL